MVLSYRKGEYITIKKIFGMVVFDSSQMKKKNVINYNLLNLPTRITFANYMGDISYTYSAMGEKLAEQYLYGTDRTHGLDAYDFGARTYFADRMQWGQMDPLCEKYYNISPYAYCMNNPVNLIDPIGMEPVYNMDGEFLGTTSEGFTGDVMIYSGFMKINFESYSRKMLEEKMSDYFRAYDTVNGSNRDGLSNDTKSKIWTDLVSHFEGTQIYDEKFSMSTILGGVIEFKDIGSNHWLSEHNYNEHYGYIRGGDRYKESYETTVENLASSIIVHEWYTHIRKDAGKRFKSHRLAYKNVINWKPFWDKTTDRYKFFCLWQLQYYTKKETGRSQVDPIYRNLFNRYVK